MPYTTDAVRVEAAWTTTQALAAAPAWQDMSALVALEQGITWNRGRSDAQSQVAAGRLTYALRNDTGDFTPGLTTSPNYPNVVLGRRTRVTVRLPSASAGNLASAEAASFEGGTTGGWAGSPFGYTACTIANTATFAQFGTKALLVTWPTAGVNASATALNVSGMVLGRAYTASVYVRVPTGSPAARLAEGYGQLTTAAPVGFVATSSTFDAFQRIAITFVAAVSTATFVITNATAATSGQTVVVDGFQVDEGALPVTFSTTALSSLIMTRIDAVIDSLDVAITPNGAVTKVGASDLLKRIGDNNKLGSLLAEEILYDAPFGYWPLSEPDGSTSSGDVSSATSVASLVATQRGTGGTLQFGVGTGPGYDGVTAPVFTPVNTTNGLYLTGTSSNLNSAPYAVTFGCFVNTSTAATQVIAKLLDGNGSFVSLEVTAAGKLLAQVSSAFSGVQGSLTSANNVTGGTKHVAVTISISGTTATLTLYLDGASAGTTTFAQSSGLLYGWTTIRVGGGPADPLLTGTVSHVAIHPTALTTRIQVQRDAGLTGFVSELSGTRAARLLRVAGVPTALVNTEAGLSTMAPQSTNGQSPFAALQEVADAERGLVFAAGDGRITFHGRSHRYNASASATFDAEADLGAPDLTSTLNDQSLVNDVTATRPGGATQRAVNQSSIDTNGTYSTSISMLVDSDSLAQQLIQSVANAASVPQPRTPELPVDLLTISTAQATAALGLDIGARVDVTNLPPSAPSSTLSLFVEGLSETVTQNAWDVKFATSPATYTAVWILDSATYSQLDSSTVLAL